MVVWLFVYVSGQSSLFQHHEQKFTNEHFSRLMENCSHMAGIWCFLSVVNSCQTQNGSYIRVSSGTTWYHYVFCMSHIFSLQPPKANQPPKSNPQIFPRRCILLIILHARIDVLSVACSWLWTSSSHHQPCLEHVDIQMTWISKQLTTKSLESQIN